MSEVCTMVVQRPNSSAIATASLCGELPVGSEEDELRASGEEDEGLPHLAERLNFLFDYIPAPDDPSARYSNKKVADELTQTGMSVTAGYLAQLRSGKRRNPTARLLAAVGTHFGVPINYFLDDEVAEKIQTQLKALGLLRAAGVRGIIGRSTNNLTAEDIVALGPILDVIRNVQENKNLDE